MATAASPVRAYTSCAARVNHGARSVTKYRPTVRDTRPMIKVFTTLPLVTGSTAGNT